jgi:ketosteroid isomerase-like protein
LPSRGRQAATHSLIAIELNPVSGLEPFFAHYAERYMASDVDAVGAMYEAPLLALRAGEVIHLEDRAAVHEHLAELMAAYAQSGAARADIAELGVTPLGRSSAFVTIHWLMRDADGGVVKDFRTTYHLVTADGGWRILSYTNHDD